MPTSRREFLLNALTLTAAVAVGGGAALVTTEGGAELASDVGLKIGQREGMTVKAAAISNDEKSRIISEYLKTAQGRESLAKAMAQPLRTRRTYESIGRKVFAVEPLQDGTVRRHEVSFNQSDYPVDREKINQIRRDHKYEPFSSPR